MDAEIAFKKIQHLFIIKILSKLEIVENFLNLLKNDYNKKEKEKPHANIFNGEKLRAFLLRSGAP